MATKERAAEIVQRADSIKDENIEGAIQKTETPGLPPFETRKHMSAILRTLRLIPQTDLLLLPEDNAQKLSNAIHKLGISIGNLQNFTLQGNNPIDNLNAHRGQMLDTFSEVVQKIFTPSCL